MVRLDDWQTWPIVHRYPRNCPVYDTVQSPDPAIYGRVYCYGSARPRVQFFQTVDGIGLLIEERPLT